MTDLEKAARPHRYKDMIGLRFGMLTVVAFDETCLKTKAAKWIAQCDCGNKKSVYGYVLRNGDTSSCGCYFKNVASKTNLKHGYGRSKEAAIWRGMIRRCTNPKSNAFKDYGERGITVCDDWLDFLTFYEEMGCCPDGYSLERIDVNGPYNKENCKWIPKSLQARNTRRSLVFDGKPLAQIAEETGIHYDTLYYRLKKHGTPFKEKKDA